MKHKPKMERGSSDGGSSNESKQVFKATKCNVTYKKNQSFESFKSEMDTWKDAVKGIPELAKDLMFIEMLNTTENEAVK